MTQSWNNTRFKKSCLASLIAVLLSPSVYALESLSDENLSNTTGEGVALALENFKMVFQAPKDISAGSSYARGVANPGQADTGFIRIIPTGENYQSFYDQSFKKYYDLSYKSTYDNTVATNKTNYTNKENSVKNDTALYNTKYSEFYNSKYAAYETAEINKYWDRSNAGNKYQAYYNFNLIGGRDRAERLTIQYVKDNEPVVRDATAKVVADTQTWIAAEAARQAQLTQVDPIAAAIKGGNIAATPLANAEMDNIGERRTKADLFIYGLALSKNDGDLNTRFSNQGFNWGTADNPWLIHAGTQKQVKQFSNTNTDISYIAIEAPLMTVTPTEADNNIKLGFWTDIFSRKFNSSNAVDPITGGPKSGLDLDQRLRLQVVANGLSLNGSQVRLFQTATNQVTVNGQLKHTNYSETLGMTSLIRINTNDRPETLTQTSSDLNAKGIRISTAARDNNSDGDGPTPALNGSAAPIFHQTEGLYIYSPNINLVLGNMYQPFIVGSEGNNIILEVTRIPNIAAIYNEIYQNYGGGLGTTDLKGSTCNVYQCGTPIKNHETDLTANYQGRTATHSSISIGSVERIAGTNQLRAKDTANSTGIIFKDTTGVSKNFGSAVIDGVLIQHLKIKTTGL